MMPEFRLAHLRRPQLMENTYEVAVLALKELSDEPYNDMFPFRD